MIAMVAVTGLDGSRGLARERWQAMPVGLFWVRQLWHCRFAWRGEG
jgi:hypothetical protein